MFCHLACLVCSHPKLYQLQGNQACKRFQVTCQHQLSDGNALYGYIGGLLQYNYLGYI